MIYQIRHKTTFKHQADNEKIKISLPEYFRIVDWRELNPSLFNAIEVERNVMFIILLLIIIVAAFNLISSMMILVSTKEKDIGVLRVIGVSKSQILKIFIINGFFIGFMGTVLGLVLGFLFCFTWYFYLFHSLYVFDHLLQDYLYSDF